MIKRVNGTSKHLELQDLMLYRVHEILLVASPYDAFILEEDGRLTEQILNEYLAMKFHQSPRLWQAETGKSALDLMTKRDFDVVIVMLRLSDMDSIKLCSKIKKLYPDKPIILLIFDEYEIEEIPADTLYKNIDKVFLWTGNPNVFPAMMKYIEDKNNSKRDIIRGGVRTIIFIEDNPRYYSMILPLLYKEIMFHTRKLVDKSLDATNRLIHLRGRTKVLLASTFEEAENYFNLYRENTLGIISDVRFPKNGKIDNTAGIQFTNYVRKNEPYIPVVIQSSILKSAQKAKVINADFLYKHSQSLLKDLRKFMLGNFGFGDFIFRNLNGEEIAKASDISTLHDILQSLPQESLLFHAKSNHFSNWLANRGEFNLYR
jgi:CheY-like chemotaxis protein